MADRKPVSLDMGTELLRPAAAPVDTYVTPPRSPMRDFAEALSKIDAPLQQFLDDRAKKQAEEDAIRGEAAFYDDNAGDIAELVQTGRLPAHYSPAFVRGFKAAQGNVEGNKLRGAFNAAFDAWEGKNSDDPEAYDAFVKDFLQQNLSTADPDVLRTLLPHIREINEQGYGRYTQYRHERTLEGSLTAHVAAANQDIDELNREGLSTEEGTNYPVVFEKIAEKRAQFTASGGNPADFDKSMIDAVSAKVLATRDPGLLAWFEQKVPGTNYTYEDTPYGSKVKLETEQALEVIARRNVAEEAERQRLADEKRKDDATRAAIEFLVENPSAPIPDDILKAGEVDPAFKVRIEEWRRSLSQGFSDPKRVQAVYAAILSGGGYKAVTEAFANGVFGRPEDMREAYAFAKSFEDSRDRITAMMGSATAESFLRSIDARTKKQPDGFTVPILGTTNEGYEAQYDFRRLATMWLLEHPDASAAEAEDALNKIGRAVLDRIVVPEFAEPGAAGTYERAGDMGFENPFTEGTTPAPEQEIGPAGVLDSLTPEQRAVVEERARALGTTPEQLLEGAVPPPEAGNALPSPNSYRPTRSDVLSALGLPL